MSKNKLMKKIFAAFLACVTVFALTACGNAGGSSEESPATEANASETSASKTQTATEEAALEKDTEIISEPETENTEAAELIVYFSWSGNTEAVALEIQEQTGADIFRIVPEEPYTDDYDTLLDIAQEEQRNNARPEIAGSIENFDSYKVVYLCFPIWWGDMPMILYSFLDENDLSGKTVVPFATSGGSGFSDTIRTIENMEPEANVLEGLSLGSSQAADSGSAVTDWLNSVGLGRV